MSFDPHGGNLVNRVASAADKEKLTKEAASYPKLVIDNRVASDCEMLANGGFSPLTGFMNQTDAESVINKTELANGLLWSIPIVLPVPKSEYDAFGPNAQVALADSSDRVIAIIKTGKAYTLDLNTYCQNVYKTTEAEHPGVKAVLDGGNHFVEAELVALLNRPQREDIAESYFIDPADTRKLFQEKGWKRVLAFQTRNPSHRAHEHLIKCALETMDGALIHPLVGETKSDDIPANIRMRCYESLIEGYFNPQYVTLSVLPAAMRYAGPKEAIHHMIIRKNYGCTHMIIGRDHAGVGNYYGTYEAQEMVYQYASRLGIEPMMFEHAAYSKHCQSMVSPKTGPKLEDDLVFLSGTKVRQMLQDGISPPAEFTRPEVAKILIEWAQIQCPAR